MDTNVKRGDIFYADLSPVVGSEPGGTRPVLIGQNDTGSHPSPTAVPPVKKMFITAVNATITYTGLRPRVRDFMGTREATMHTASTAATMA